MNPYSECWTPLPPGNESPTFFDSWICKNHLNIINYASNGEYFYLQVLKMRDSTSTAYGKLGWNKNIAAKKRAPIAIKFCIIKKNYEGNSAVSFVIWSFVIQLNSSAHSFILKKRAVGFCCWWDLRTFFSFVLNAASIQFGAVSFEKKNDFKKNLSNFSIDRNNNGHFTHPPM